MRTFKFELGIEVQDVITEFTGIIMSRSEHLTGCNVYSVAPKVLTDGKPGETQWYDENRLIKVSDGVADKFQTFDTGSTGNQPMSTNRPR